jgi:hypothetical protein
LGAGGERKRKKGSVSHTGTEKGVSIGLFMMSELYIKFNQVKLF